MRALLTTLALAATVAFSLAGCPGRGSVPEPDPTPDPPPLAADDAIRPTEISDEGDMGLYSDPGDLPPLALAEGILKYADLDGDGEREAIVVGVVTVPGDGDDTRSVAIVVSRYDHEQGDWKGVSAVEAGRGETQYDEDSIFLAYDMDGDGLTEIGVLLYEDDGDERSYNCYLYKLADDELELSLHPLLAAVMGAITWSEGEGATVADVTDQLPGDELIVTSREKSPGEAGPSVFHMHVYGWAAEGFGPYLWYASDDEFDDSDTATAAFLNHEGGYWLDNYEAAHYDPDRDDRWDPRRFENR